MTTTDTQVLAPPAPGAVPHWPMIIDGREYLDGARRAVRHSPAHLYEVATVAYASAADVDRAARAAQRAAGPWNAIPAAERARILREVAGAILRERDELALIETLESGKPITQARGEVEAAAGLWHYAATLAYQRLGEAYDTLGPGHVAWTWRRPLGVAGLITPWNFPLLIASQKLPFALAAGCTVVIKPSELTPGTTTRLVQLVHEAGAPPGVVNLVHGDGEVGAHLVAHDAVAAVSFTGSTRVGAGVGAVAGGRMARVTLELGGKNPQVVLPDADLEAAARAVAWGATFNQGECCNAGSRALVHRDIAEPFAARVASLIEAQRVGDPLDPSTEVGALISARHLSGVHAAVEEARAAGARILTGGHLLSTPGHFYAPTVAAGVRRDATLATAEIFGPVLSVLSVDSLADAIAVTAHTSYGLSAGIWTESMDAAMTFARSVRAGTVWINGWMDGFPEVPFGGTGASGMGRELGPHALDDYTESTSVIVRTAHISPHPPAPKGETTP